MSSIQVRDLAHASRLDCRSMASVRGGSAIGSPGMPNVTVNIALKQQIAQVQDIGVNVLNNNGVIGAGFEGPGIELSPLQWAKNEASLPKF
ncbi:hypothetical protein ACI48D_06250 [Massilia sp. LXY-6]|uniref:hypothetical protein n=1 Tax=Massilia sp. LXY-6 TaxID=3379823 RepID=UPI003EDF2A91